MIFKVEVNPFTRKATINVYIDKILYTQDIYFNDIDEWNSFKFAGKVFNIHFHYEAEFLVNIYLVENNKIDYSKSYTVELTFKMTD